MRLLWMCVLCGWCLLGACQGTNTGTPDGGEAIVDGSGQEVVSTNGCRAESACIKPKECQSPGPRPPVCGIPPMDTCQQDADCQKNDPKSICKAGVGTCGGKGCAPGCKADTDCLVGESCKSDGHCKPTECIDNMTCPKNFICNAQRVCQRQTCQKSDQCVGYCVNGLCFEQTGTCVEVIAVP